MTKRYVAYPFGVGTAYPREGNTVSPAPRTYGTAMHAQLSCPAGRVYIGHDSSDPEIEGHDQFTLDERFTNYPMDLMEVRVPGIGATAEGAVVLRDMGPTAHHRWATHYRNDQLGGYSGGAYYGEFSRAVEGFAEVVARELKLTAARFREPVEA